VAVANNQDHQDHDEHQEQQEHGALAGLKTGEAALRLVGALFVYHKPLLMSRINIDLLPMLLERMTHKIEIEIDHGTEHEERGGGEVVWWCQKWCGVVCFCGCDFAVVILLV